MNLHDYRFHKSDKITCPSSPHDFQRLPYTDRFFDVVVFDPPYAHHAAGMRIEPCYNNSSTAPRLCHRGILEVYQRGMTEAVRVLRAGGTLWVKCSDEVESGRQKRSHIEVFEIARALGLEDQDLFVLMQQGPPVTNGRRQQHARKNCSFLWVFRNPSPKTAASPR